MTADGALAKTGCRAGQTLLILGATGGVGVLATQLAAQDGITVIATARANSREQITAISATQTIDDSQQSVVDALLNRRQLPARRQAQPPRAAPEARPSSVSESRSTPSVYLSGQNAPAGHNDQPPPLPLARTRSIIDAVCVG